ncbi:MotA/TolQ/ExbB proton channel family protein [Vibrio crassostreae]|uniref:MotA/TolQ/ExbB proton channel family protein n=1 Tax=Vibrio crassostreae TaxID=246167 RepID=UPI001B3013B7|nr:MotA/TolQ/ExbB proton channel family protein [Vibrio crassostreae]
MGFFEVFLHASFFVKMIITTLICLSLMSWTVFIWKTKVIRAEQVNLANTSKLIQQEGFSELLGKLPDDSTGNIISKIYKQALGKNVAITSSLELEDYRARVSCVADTVLYNYEKSLSKHLSLLATVSSISPYIGLLGTVWGILDTFNLIAGVEVVTLQTVAPGIGEALVATAIGLAATIPAYVFYNILVQKISTLLSDVEKLGLQVSTTIGSTRVRS